MHLVHAHLKQVLASVCFMLMFTYPNVNLCAHTPTSAGQMFKQFLPSLVSRKRGGGNVLTVMYNCLLQTVQMNQPKNSLFFKTHTKNHLHDQCKGKCRFSTYRYCCQHRVKISDIRFKGLEISGFVGVCA